MIIDGKDSRDFSYTAEELDWMSKLRSRGCAVIVWTPEELQGVNPKYVQDRSIELGWDVIDDLKMYATVEDKA